MKETEKIHTCWDGVIKALLPIGLLCILLWRQALLKLLLRKLHEERGGCRRWGHGLDNGGLHGFKLDEAGPAVVEGWERWEKGVRLRLQHTSELQVPIIGPSVKYAHARIKLHGHMHVLSPPRLDTTAVGGTRNTHH